VLQESLTLKEETGDQPGLATGYHEHGNVLLMTGKHEDAVKRYEQALDIEIQMRDMQGIAVTKSQLGLAHKELFQFDEAYGAFFTARDLFHRLQSPNEAVIESAIAAVSEMIDYATIAHQKSKAQAFVNQLMVAPTITMTETQADTA
jgi:tetratricopeptide (TPR) repeat protein